MRQPWHELYVRSNYEKKVSKYLAAHSVDPYLPLHEELSQWSDRNVLVERPAFPGYPVGTE